MSVSFTMAAASTSAETPSEALSATVGRASSCSQTSVHAKVHTALLKQPGKIRSRVMLFLGGGIMCTTAVVVFVVLITSNYTTFHEGICTRLLQNVEQSDSFFILSAFMGWMPFMGYVFV